MPDQPVPPISGPNTQKSSSPVFEQVTGSDNTPIRLKPETAKLPVSSHNQQSPSPQVSTPPVDEHWEEKTIEAPKRFSRLLVPSVFCLALCLLGALLWGLFNKEKDTGSTQLSTPPDLNSTPKEQGQAWKSKAQHVLRNYLHATAKDDLKARMLCVTPSQETQTALPRYQPPQDSSDVVDTSSFVAKTLPQSFLEHGIYLMYYERPNTLSDDAVFRPIVPMRVKLKLDSPAFLDISALSGRLRDRNQQNICAFFKRHHNGQLTLDWPLFAQTRHRQLARFVQNQDIKSRQVFRLMVLQLEPTLKENIYSRRNPGNDWYRIHCPGYVQETHIISIPSQSPAAKILKQLFAVSAANHQQIRALTAELAWVQNSKNQQPTLGISKIICLEFLGLNAELKKR